jgi:hypothetical protein
LPAKVRTFIDHLVEYFQQPGQQARDPRTVAPARSVTGAAEVVADMDDLSLPELAADAARPSHKAARSRIAASSPF